MFRNTLSTIGVAPVNRPAVTSPRGPRERAIRDALLVYDRDTTSGQLSLSSNVANLFDGVEGIEEPADLALDPESANLYVGCRADSLATFQVGIFRDGFESGDTEGW